MKTASNHPMNSAERTLSQLLRGVYFGELSAALAYVGHARSVRDPEQRAAIERIRRDELDHRKRVGEMLAELGGGPSRARELVFRLIGRVISVFCYVGGWYMPMYGAGRIERRNIAEYVAAADLATAAERHDWAEELLHMAVVEWDHEQYFRARVTTHWARKLLPVWPAVARPTRARPQQDTSNRAA